MTGDHATFVRIGRVRPDGAATTGGSGADFLIAPAHTPTPTCGHTDGWCGGVLGPDTCTQRPGKWAPRDDHPGRDEPAPATDADCDRAADEYEERFR